jgi:hypothetical protein
LNISVGKMKLIHKGKVLKEGTLLFDLLLLLLCVMLFSDRTVLRTELSFT